MMKKKKMHSIWRKYSVNLMYVPVLVLLLFFIVYPFCKGMRFSFTDWNGYSQKWNFVGLYNYKHIFENPDITNTIKNTFIYGFGSTLFQNIFGLCYALLLEKKIRGTKIARTIIYLPSMISGLIMGYIWYFMLKRSGGALPEIFAMLGLDFGDLLAKGNITVWIIVAVNVFQAAGGSMIFYQAGLQSISPTYYEAAELDGAGSIQKFFKITLPLLIPSIEFTIVLNLIGGFKLFDVIKSLTNGGPASTTESLSTLMYRMYFAKEQAGLAAALGNVMFVLIIVISLSALWFLRRKEVEL